MNVDIFDIDVIIHRHRHHLHTIHINSMLNHYTSPPLNRITSIKQITISVKHSHIITSIQSNILQIIKSHNNTGIKTNKQDNNIIDVLCLFVNSYFLSMVKCIW